MAHRFTACYIDKHQRNQCYQRIHKQEAHTLDTGYQTSRYDDGRKRTEGIICLHHAWITHSCQILCEGLCTVQPQLEGSGAGKADDDQCDAFRREMRIADVFKQSRCFLAGSLLCFWHRCKDHQYTNHQNRDTTDVQQYVVGKTCPCKCPQHERQQQLCCRDEEFCQHGCQRGSWLQNFHTGRNDTGIQKGIGDSPKNCRSIGNPHIR